MTELIVLTAHGAVTVLTMMFALWCLHLVIRNAAVVDVGWAAGLGLLALIFAALGGGWPERRLLVAVMGGVWSVRLALHIGHRVATEPEDGRYAEIRARWKTHLAAKFLVFFLGQGVLDLVLAIPFLAAVVNPAPGFRAVELAAAVLWLISVVGESVADSQLRGFKANSANKGRVCRVGLWSWSRHPNYFFEWLIWCAVALLALGSPWGWVGVISPALMLYFLLRVTGIPLTEAHALLSRGADYAEYQRTTSAFVPWPPRGMSR